MLTSSLPDLYILDTTNRSVCLESTLWLPNLANILSVLSLFVVRALAKHLARTPIIAVNPHPGYSELRRNYGGFASIVDNLMEKMFARTSEQGSRGLVFAVVGGTEKEDALRGAYTNLRKVQEPSDFVISEAGQEAQKRIWVRSMSFRILQVS